jgi:DNA-binding XRE family transcriptional regulator
MRDCKSRIRELRALLSADQRKPMTQERFGQFIGVAGGTVARWESPGKVDPWMARKLERLERTLSVMGNLIVREDRVKFLEQTHPLLVGLRPIDLLDNDNSCSKVVQLLEGMESGDFA